MALASPLDQELHTFVRTGEKSASVAEFLETSSPIEVDETIERVAGSMIDGQLELLSRNAAISEDPIPTGPIAGTLWGLGEIGRRLVASVRSLRGFLRRVHRKRLEPKTAADGLRAPLGGRELPDAADEAGVRAALASLSGRRVAATKDVPIEEVVEEVARSLTEFDKFVMKERAFVLTVDEWSRLRGDEWSRLRESLYRVASTYGIPVVVDVGAGQESSPSPSEPDRASPQDLEAPSTFWMPPEAFPKPGCRALGFVLGVPVVVDADGSVWGETALELAGTGSTMRIDGALPFHRLGRATARRATGDPALEALRIRTAGHRQRRSK